MLVLEVVHFEVCMSHVGGDVIVDENHHHLTLLVKFKTSGQWLFRGRFGLQPYSWVMGQEGSMLGLIPCKVARCNVSV